MSSSNCTKNCFTLSRFKVSPIFDGPMPLYTPPEHPDGIVH
jgi:hypothetical protein